MTEFSPNNINIVPNQIPGLVGWLDAADISTITTSGSDVVSIRNKVNPNIPFLGAGTFPPRSGTNRKLNDLNVLDFDGESSYLTANGMAAYFTGTDVAFTILIACVFDNEDSPTNTAWAVSRSSSANPYHYMAYTSTQIKIKRQDDAASSVETTYNFTLNQDDVNAAVFSGTAISAYWNDQTCYTGTACNVGALTLNVFTLGALLSNGSLSNFWDGSIAEVIIYNRALSDSERILAQRYLGNKWRIPTP
jgi:hypothetical protein